jgi:hypothetical protein
MARRKSTEKQERRRKQERLATEAQRHREKREGQREWISTPSARRNTEKKEKE